MAKLTNAGNYGIVSDHIGTPVEAFDAKGERIWSAELDIYGRVKEFTGEEDFIPFRYQGQYHDVETGLYYNRFRYYVRPGDWAVYAAGSDRLGWRESDAVWVCV
jgi:uncharacterized protein RhaS with RHS repeats